MINFVGHVTCDPPIDKDSKQMLRQAGSTGAVGLEIAVAIALGYFGGQFLDKKFATAPWLTAAGFLVGVGAAIKALVRVVRIYKQQNPDAPSDKQSPPGSP